MYTLEARRAFLDDFNGGRHGALRKVVNYRVFCTDPSDGCELHPTIPTAEPPAYWYQLTQRQPRNPSLGTIRQEVRTVLRDPDGYGRGWDVECCGWGFRQATE